MLSLLCYKNVRKNKVIEFVLEVKCVKNILFICLGVNVDLEYYFSMICFCGWEFDFIVCVYVGWYICRGGVFDIIIKDKLVCDVVVNIVVWDVVRWNWRIGRDCIVFCKFWLVKKGFGKFCVVVWK